MKVIALLIALLAAPAAALSPRLAGVNDWLDLLQVGDITPAQIAASQFDLVVMDYSRDGGAAGEFTSAEIASIRDSGKVVLAYLSIGEAEDYRWYWNPAWSADPPAWLGPLNPDWPGNYKVRHWDPAWQAIVFQYLDRIVGQGFDGAYLDIVDGFEYWSAENPERTRSQARADMAAFVLAIRDHARTARGRSSFLVFPQNAPAIIVDDSDNLDALGTSYLQHIDGIGAEDVFYNATTPQPPSEVDYTTALLDLFRDGAGGTRLVLSIDYVWNASNPGSAANVARYNDYESRCLARSYVPYAGVSDRDLDEILTIPAGGGITEPQPKPNAASITGLLYSGN